MRVVVRREWNLPKLLSFPRGFGISARVAHRAKHHRSLVAEDVITGAAGNRPPREHEGPEHGRGRFGQVLVEADSSTSKLAAKSDDDEYVHIERLASDVTPCPQPARTCAGAIPATARSTHTAPA
jgi:hypothetical protein